MIVLAVTAAVMPAAILGAMQGTILRAAENGLVSGRGGPDAYVIQASTDAARQTLARETQAKPVALTQGTVSTETRSVEADVVWTLGDGPGLWQLTDGRRPGARHEVGVSVAVAETLDVSVGDEILVSSEGTAERVAVVGVLVDTAERSRRFLHLAARDDELPATSYWITDRNPFQQASLRAGLDEATLQASSSGGALADLRRSPPSVLTMVRGVSTPLIVLLQLAVLGALVCLVSIGRRDVTDLVALGLRQSTAMAVVRAAVLTSACVGVGSGLLLGHVSMTLLEGPMSRRLDQYWTGIAYSWQPVVLAAVLAMMVLVAATSAPLARRTGAWLLRLDGGGAADGPQWVAAVLATVVVAAITGLLRPNSGSTGAILALAVVAGIGVVLRPRPSPTSPRLTSMQLARQLLRKVRGPLVAMAVVATLSAGYSASVAASASRLADEVRLPQPRGSLLVGEVNDVVLDRLREAYQELGGRSLLVMDDFAVSGLNLRATTAAGARCFVESRSVDNCVTRGHPLLLVSSGDGAEVRVSPELIGDGRAALVVIDPADQSIVASTNLPAQRDDRLGGFLPSVVLPRTLGLPAGYPSGLRGTHTVLFEDFFSLGDGERARFRSAVLRSSPSSPFSEEGDVASAYAQEQALARLGALGGTALTLALGGTAVAASTVGNRRVRRTLVALGATGYQRCRFCWRALSGLVAGVGVAAVGMPLAVRGPTDGVDLGSLGLVWLLPLVAAVVIVLVAVLGFARNPSTEPD